MSHIPGMNDADLHHEDHSHRWTGGDGTPKGEQEWRDRVEIHMGQHRAGLDRPTMGMGALCAVPRPRTASVETDSSREAA